jgi:hypothetical protein
MNISINVKKSHVAAIVTAILVFAGVQVAEATILSSAGSKLCVTKSGAVFARNSCKASETLFSVMPGKVKKVPIKEIEIGSSTFSSKDSQSLASVMNTTVTSLSLLATTPRVFTNIVTFPEGLTINSLDSNFSSAIPNCPADAPFRTGQFVEPLKGSNGQSPMGMERLDGGDSISFAAWANGVKIVKTFQPTEEITRTNIEDHIWFEFNIPGPASESINFRAYFYGNSSLGDGNGGVLEEESGEYTFNEDVSFYVSVTCIPTVNLVASK